MTFHLGKPILAMLIISLISGGAILLSRRPQTTADLNVWVFADTHARSYRDLADIYRQQTGNTFAVNVISSRALDVRLISLFNSPSADMPDLVEVEIGSVGKYFRPPADEVGFLPLNKFLERDGLTNRFVASRFAPWSKHGVIFGIPNDLHPVTITYRKDLFDAAGIDLASAKTWDDFHSLSLRFQEYWKSRGETGRWAIELPGTASDYLTVMLLQRHINIIDDYNRVHLSEEKVTDTIARYAKMVAGPRRIGADSTPGGDLWAMDLLHGDICAVITPDWRAGFLRERAPGLFGKLAMMPLPRFDPDDAPTSTWGGTMIGIPRAAKNPEQSWRLLKFLYLGDEALKSRQRISHIIPPIRDQWKDPAFDHPDPFFANQKIDQLYIHLADQIPARYVTPFSAAGSLVLARVLSDARSYVESHAADPPDKLDSGLRQSIQKNLDWSAQQLKQRIDFGTIE